MAIIEWSESLSSGINSIDAEHKKLIQAINKFEDYMRQGGSETILKEVLDEFERYHKAHFPEEERILKVINYPNIKSHQDEHSFFIRKVAQFKDDSINGTVSLKAPIMNFICDWARDHMKKADIEYVKFIAKQRSTL